MASYDGSINIDARLNIKNAVINSKDLGKAIESLKSTVDTFGKDAAQSTNAYVNVLTKASTVLSDVSSAFSGIESGAQQMIGSLSDTSLINKSWQELKSEMIDLQVQLGQMKDAGLTENDWQLAEVKERLEDVTRAIDAKVFSSATDSVKQDIATLMQQLELLGSAEGVDPYLFEELEQSIPPIIDQIKRLTNIYAGLSGKSQSTGREMSDSMEEARQSTQSLEGGLEDVENAESRVQTGTQEMAQSAEQSAQETSNAMNETSESANNASVSLSRAANSATRFASKIASGALKTAVNTIKSMGSAAVRAAANLAKMVGGNVLSFLRKLAEGAKNAAVQLAKMVTSAVANGVKKLGTLAGKATKSLLGLNKASRGDGFKEGLKFLVRYGFGVRSLFMLYRKLRGAVVEAFENMAKKVPEVNKSLSRLASSFDLLKNSLATAFQPILTAVTPYLVQLMDMMSEAAAKVGEFFAVLTGQNYIYKATKANIDYAKSLDKSTKSTKKNTKETENQLAAFDHLNILKENKDTGSSSDSDKNETPTSDFKRVPIESAISDLARRIKDAFNKGDFTEIGKILANKLTEWVNEVDWDGLGKKIGQWINHIVDVVNGFFDNFDWVDLGQKFAEGLNSLIDNVNFYELGRAMTQKLRALIETAWGVVSDINWEKVGDAIGNYIQGVFDNIPWETLGETVGTAITGVFRALQNAIVSFGWADAGERLANALNSMFDSINWVQIGNTINALFKGVLKGLRTFIATFEWDKHAAALERGFRNFIKKLPTADIGEVLKNATIKILGFIRKGLGDKNTWSLAGSKFSELLNKLFETDDSGRTIWDELADSVDALASDVTAAIGAAVAKFEWGENGKTFHDAVLRLVENFPLDELGSGLSDLMASALEFLNETLGDEKLFNQLGTDTADFFNKFTGNTALWDEIGEGVNNAFLGVLEFGQSFIDGFKEDDAANAIKTAIGKIDFDDIATKTWNLLKSAFAKAGSFVDALFSDGSNVDQEIIRNRNDPGYSKLYSDLAKENSNHALALGKKIGKALSDAIGKINWSEFGSSFSKMATDLFDTINGFFQGIADDKIVTDDGRSISKLQDAIERFFGAIDWESVGNAIKGAAVEAFKTLGGALFGAINDGFRAEMEENHQDLVDTTIQKAEDAGEDVSTALLKIGEAPADAYYEGFKSRISNTDDVTAETMSAMDIILSAADTEAKGGSEAEQFYSGFRNTVLDKNGEVKDEFVGILNEIFTEGDLEAISSGKMSAEDFVFNFNAGTSTLSGDATEELQDFFDIVFASQDTSTPAKGLATDAVDGTVSELDSKKEEVKKAYEGTFVKTYEDSVEGANGFDIGSGKSSRTGKLGIAAVRNLSEGMDSENGTLQRSLKGIVDTSNSSWGDVEEGQSQKLGAMSSNLSSIMEQMTSTSEDETSNQAKPVYDNYGEIMVAVDECMRAARDYLAQYAGEMTTDLSNEMDAMGRLSWYEVGNGIVQGIANGINNGWSWLNNTVWNLANSLFQSAKNALGIHSPSKVFREGIGENVGLGIAEGILDTKSEVMDSVASLADLASETMNETDLGDFVNADGTGLVDGLDNVLDVFSNKVQNSFSDMLSKLNAIANTVTFRTPAIATGTVLPYAIQGDVNVSTDNVAVAIEKNNEELINIMIQLVNNQTSAIVAGLERYCTTNVNIDKKGLTDAIIEEINRRTRAAGSSPLLI